MTEEDSKMKEAEKKEEKKEDEKDENENEKKKKKKNKEKEEEDEKEKEEEKEKENIFDSSMEWEISCILPFFENDTDLLIAVICPNNECFQIPNYYQWNTAENKIISYHPTHLTEDGGCD